jgi:hypothetical protein
VRCALVNINQYWAANILEEDIEIDDNTLQELIEVNDKYTKLHAHVPDVLDENRVGRLLLTDPISQRSRALNHTQNVDFTPHPKWFVMHPAYIYHQSEPYLGTKDRKFFVFVIRIVEPIQMPYYRKL